MHNIEKARAHVNTHPLIALLAIGVVALLSLPVAAVMLAACLLTLAWPKIERARSPEARAEDAVQAMQRQTLRVVQTVSSVMADETLLARAVEREAFQSRSWEARATKAMLAGNEEEAERCLARKHSHDAARGLAEGQLELQREAVKGMRPRVDAMRRETATAAQAGELLAVRARRAEAKRTVVLTASGLETKAGEQAFQRLADDVARAEAEADALESLVGCDCGDEHAASWEQQERSEAVKSELDALRQRVGMGRKALTGSGERS